MPSAGKNELANSDHGWSDLRNLGKGKLGGVIFGATNTTINECLSKQLFGLPSKHILYVQKIDPGLPLFLFNYDLRILIGIFEAASSGQMKIDPHAWTGGGSQRTQYPAQVRTRLRLQCQALTEHQFKPIIGDNYYSANRFWFELDHAQTNRLLSSFSSVAVSVPRMMVSAPQTTLSPRTSKKWTRVSRPVPKSEKREAVGPVYQPLVVGGGYSCQSNGHNNHQPVDHNLGMTGEDEKELIYMKLKELALQRELSHSPPAVREDGIAVVNEVTRERNGHPEEVIVNSEKKDASPASSSESLSLVAELLGKVEDLAACKTEQNEKIVNMEQKIISLEQKLAEAETETRNLKDHCKLLESMVGPREDFCDVTTRESPSEIHSDCSPEGGEIHLDGSPEGSEIHLESGDLIFLMGGFDGKSWLSSLECFSPSVDVTKSLKPMSVERAHAPVSKLNGELYVFGGTVCNQHYDTVASYDPFEDQWTTRPPLNAKKGSLAGATVNEKLYAVGGFNGLECYSAVETLDLDAGAWIPTRPMLQKRDSLAAAELNGALYAVGGCDRKNYLNSVERFDPRERSWTQIASMNTRRGCPSLVVLNEKLYVLGGYDGNAMVPTVEIYDPRHGPWMTGEPMKFARGYSASAVVKGSIYVFGGTNNEKYNDTVERYKEGQGWEIVNTKAVGPRCFFSAIAL